MPSQYTEFCIKPTGSNLNAGTLDGGSSDPGDSPAFEYASGDWDGATVFTVASGDPSTDGVQVGQFASIYADGSSTTGFVAKITAVSSTTITVDGTAQSGTAPGADTGNRTLRVGGAWAGPSGASSFVCPDTGDFHLCGVDIGPVRINVKGGTTYSHTAQVSLPARVIFQGYTTSYGDGGFATFDHGANNITAITGSGGVAECLEVTGTAGIGFTQGNVYGSAYVKCRVSGCPTGFNSAGLLYQCEAYNCTTYGYNAVNHPIQCYAHSCGTGFRYHSSMTYGVLSHCVADSCTTGFDLHQGASLVVNCDAYNCTNSGFANFYNSGQRTFVNCNAVKCGTGFNGYTAGTLGFYQMLNCGFGGGAYANTNDIGSSAGFYAEQINCVTHETHPWFDPDNGDFRLVGGQSIGAGLNELLQSYNSKSGSVGTIDIGAIQSAPLGGLLRVGMNGGFGG